MTIDTAAIPLRTDKQGVIRVGGTRLPLDTIVFEFEAGRTPEQIIKAFDVVTLADVYAAIGYYLANRDQVRTYLERRRKAGEELKRQCEARWPTEGIRARLLARRASGKGSQ